MDSGMSLSDIAAVTRGANDENGWGSGWFLIVVLFLFMFGFGGNGWNRQGEFGQYATAASQQEILFGQQFGQLNDRLTNIGNGICNLGYEMQGGIGQQSLALFTVFLTEFVPRLAVNVADFQGQLTGTQILILYFQAFQAVF